MILSLRAIADAAALEALRASIAALTWRDGRRTAGATARAVKTNQQAVLTDPAGRGVAQTLKAAVENNAIIKAAARPRRFSPLIISRMEEGGRYGPHVDNAFMSANTRGETRLRTDLSFTLFLTPLDQYQGGELTIHAAGTVQTVKGEAGELVLYPSTSVHEVRPVTGGERIVCVGWIESLIADPARRELLFDLENLRSSLRETCPPASAELLTIDKTIGNLMRMWSRA